MNPPEPVRRAAGAAAFGVVVWIMAGLTAGLTAAAVGLAAGFIAGPRIEVSRLGKIYLFIALCLPLSVEIGIDAGAVVALPSEFLLAVLALSAPAILPKTALRRLLLNDPLPALWMLSFLPALAFSEMTMVSAKYTAVQGCYVVVFYYLLIFAASRNSILERMWVIYAVAMLPAGIWAAWQFTDFDFNPVTIPGIFKPFFNDHTLFGAVCAALAAAFGALGILRKQRGYSLASVIFIAAVVFSGSRAAMLSLGALPAVLLFAYSAFWRKLIPAAMVAVLALVLVGRTQVQDYFRENMPRPAAIGENILDRLKSSTNTRTDVSNLERLNRWHAALGMWRERPHTGFGPGTYQFVYIPYQSPGYENRLTVRNPERPPEGSGGTAHSELLLQLSENGWPSTLLFLGFLLRLLWYFARYGRTARPVLCAAAAGLFTYYIHMMFNNFLSTASFAFLFWSMAAAVEIQIIEIRRVRE